MKVEIYADILCPWCYIGKRRLSAALAKIADRDRNREQRENGECPFHVVL